MLNQIEFALLRARGYNEPTFETLNQRDVVARASKSVGNRVVRVEALGRSRDDATRKLIGVVTRP